MPRRLILMRHAKSDWGDPGLRDHDRPLNRRGRLASTLMGAWMRDEGVLPDHAIVSSAARTRETWSRLGLGATMAIEPKLYHASAETILAVARGAPEEASNLLILCHMPHIVDAANQMIGRHAISSYPTAKVVVIEFTDETWFEIAFGDGELIVEAAPKDLI